METAEAIRILKEHTNPDSYKQYGSWQIAQRKGIEALEEKLEREKRGEQ